MDTYLLKRQGDSVVAVKHDINKEVNYLTERKLKNKEAAPYIEDELERLNKFHESDTHSVLNQMNGNVLVKFDGREKYGRSASNGKYRVAYLKPKAGVYNLVVEDVDDLRSVENDLRELDRIHKLTVNSFINLDKSVVWRVK